MKYLYTIAAFAALPLIIACSQASVAGPASSSDAVTDASASYGSGSDGSGIDSSVDITAPDTKDIDSVAQHIFKEVRTDGLEIAIFAGGCFWCTESDFEKVPGVVEAISGYTGGAVHNPNYKQVSYTETGHFEAVKVIYNPAKVSYRELVDGFWMTIDPTDRRGQFCDKGTSYLSAVFATEAQFKDATESRAQIVKNKPFTQEFVTPVLPALTFYDAEDYHQDYYKTNSAHYNRYRNGCGRDRRLAQLWGEKR